MNACARLNPKNACARYDLFKILEDSLPTIKTANGFRFLSKLKNAHQRERRTARFFNVTLRFSFG